MYIKLNIIIIIIIITLKLNIYDYLIQLKYYKKWYFAD